MKIELTLEQIKEMQGLFENEVSFTLESNVIVDDHRNRIGEIVGSSYRYEFYLVIEPKENKGILTKKSGQ